MIAEFLGRLHPLFVHLPIGILVLAFIMQWASRNKRYLVFKAVMPFILLVCFGSLCLSFLTGWIMPKEGDFDARLISFHFWMATGLTVTVGLLCLISLSGSASSKKYLFLFFFLAMILLAGTGHYGGSLTHGTQHLTAPLVSSHEAKVSDVNKLLVYQDIVMPILKDKCWSCHNEGKQKGGLRMSSTETFKNGGETGVSFLAGDATNSLVVQRINLPEEDEKHMPPEGKKALTKNEILLLEWWIDEGASFNAKVATLKKNVTISSILKSYETSDNEPDPKDLKFLSESQLNTLRNGGISVIPNSKTPFIEVSLSRDTIQLKRKLKKLNRFGDHIIGLDLSFSAVTDRQLSIVKNFRNLKRLKLQKTSVTDRGVEQLADLKYLSLINLYGTSISNSVFESLNEIKSLKSVFLWESGVTKEAVKDFKESHPLVDVQYNFDNSIFGDAQLKPPTISAEKEIFDDTLRVELSLSFKGVNVYYTIDGSPPDSTSLQYEAPFLIDQTRRIRAITYKKDWTTSEVSERIFIKAKHKVKDIKLATQPNDKYKANGASSLVDFKKGTTSFVDGQWLGYEGAHMLASLDLGSAKESESIVVGALQDVSSYIFYPKQIKISGSKNGEKYENLAQLNIPITEGPVPVEIKSFKLDYPSTDLRFIKVHVLGHLKNPQWHPAPGAKNWIFIDEIIVN